MQLFAGIDGGQSHTEAVVVDAGGLILGRGTAGPSDHVGEAETSRRAAEACETALRRALEAAGLDPATPLAAVVAGISGFEGSWHGVEPVFAAPVVRFEHDAPIALAGATDERPAGVVIAGTGSAGFGVSAAGRRYAVGGYGYLFGDEGSSFAIARSALATAMRFSDRGVATDLGEAALAFFDVASLRALVRAVSLHEIDRARIASFARVVHDASRLGDDQARAILEDAAAALAALAVLLVERLDGTDDAPVGIALSGGTFANADLRAGVERRFANAAPRGRLLPDRYEPAVGAALLAFDAAGESRPLRVAPA